MAERILLIKTSSLGDVAHCVPAARRLREARPGARIAWLANPELLPLIGELAEVDELIPFPRAALGRWREAPGALRGLWGRLRGRFDVAIDWQGLARSALTAWMSGARIRIGPARAREGTLLYTRRVRTRPARGHPIKEALAALGGLGIAPGEPAPPGLSEACQARAAARCEAGAIVLAPGARWASKRWPAARWEGLAAGLRGERVVVVGGPEEVALGGRIAALSGGRSLCGETDLVELAGVLAGAELVVAGDSGPLHLAALLGRPVLGLYGPTTWRRTYPWGAGHILARRGALSCLGCRRRVCPRGDQACLQEMREEAVLEALRALRRGARSRVHR